MSLTKIGSIGVSTGIQFAGVTTVATLHVGSGVTLSSDGDIFATGVSTVTTLKVGSGVTLSSDGDIFATGVTTTGSLVSSGAVSGTTGTFSGAVSGTTGTFTGDVDIADTIVHTGDTNTKIRFPSTDNISFEVAGTERLRIDDSDGVISKHTTAANLRIQNSTAASSQDATLDMAPANGVSGVQLKATSEEDFSTGANRTAIFSVHVRKDGTFSERLRIDSSGRLLLGTTTEGHTNGDDLTIATSGGTGMTIRSGTSDTGSIFFSDGTSGAAEYVGLVQYDHANNFMRFYAGGSEQLRVNSSGHLLLGTTTAAVTAGKALMIAATDGARIKLCDSDLGVTGNDGYEMIASNNGTAYLWNRENTDLLFGTNNTERLRITSAGTVLHGSGAVATQKATNGGLDVACNGLSIIFGADSNSGNPSQARTNNTAKDQRIASVHYTNAEEPIGIVRAYSDSSTNQLSFGGGSSILNAATQISFYTASNNTTSNGTERFRINSSGHVTKPNQPKFGYHGTSSWTTISNGQSPALALATAVISSSDYNTSNYRFTASTTGYYWFGCNLYTKHASMDTSSPHYISGGIRINGAAQQESNTIQHYQNASDGDTGYFISHFHYLNANDYVSVVLQANGADFQYYGAHCYFYGWLVA